MAENLRRQSRGDRHEHCADQQPLGRDQFRAPAVALQAFPGVAGKAFAPQAARPTLPAQKEFVENGAPRCGVQRAYHRSGGVELGAHAAYPERKIRRAQPQRVGQLAAGELTGRLQPPQRQQLHIITVKPARRFRELPALPGQLQAGDGEVHEVGSRTGDIEQLRGVGGGSPPSAYLPHRDRDQP